MKGNKRMASKMIDDHDETSKPFNPLEAEREGQERKVKWVYYDGTPSGKEKVVSTAPEEVMADVDKVLKGEDGNLQELLFRDPATFKAGELQSHVDLWNIILDGYKEKENVIKWVGSGVDVETFFKDEYRPSSIRLQNNQSCQTHSSFVTETLLERIRSGAVRVWGMVGECRPPWLVLPMTVADPTTKPRLCINARHLNDWMKEIKPKSTRFESLDVVPDFVYTNSYLSKVDDKSAFLHIRLTENSEEYFGIEWQGWWFVFKTLPFGWNKSSYVYQTIGLGVTNFLRSRGISCSLYTDDRLNGELFTCRGDGRWSKPIAERTPEFSSQAAKAALYVVCKVLINLGYFLGLNKCIFEPSTSIVHLGMRIDSTTQSFSVPQEKKETFAKLREEILKGESASLKRLKGKCLSYSKAFPLADLYVSEMSDVNVNILSDDGSMPSPLRKELEFWRFLDGWEGAIPWRRDKSVRVSLSISQLKWTAIIHLTSGDQTLEGEQPSTVRDLGIQAVKGVLENLPSDLQDCEVKIEVDNKEVVDEWKKGNLIATNEIFELVINRNILVKMDTTSGFAGSDAMLSQSSWNTVQAEFGGQEGHNFDLMSLDVNCQKGKDGRPLPHYTPYPTPDSAGVDVFSQDLSKCDGVNTNAYVYPPFSLIPKLLRYFIAQGAVVTMVVPKFSPVRTWWPIINYLALKKKRLAKRGDQDAILYPDKHGYFQKQRSFVELWAFRIDGKRGKPV